MLASLLLMTTLKYEVIYIAAGSSLEQALKSAVTVVYFSTVNWISDCCQIIKFAALAWFLLPLSPLLPPQICSLGFVFKRLQLR